MGMKEDSVQAQAILDNRLSMIKQPKEMAVHVTDYGQTLVTFAEGSGKESFSFLLNKELSKELAKGLVVASKASKASFVIN